MNVILVGFMGAGKTSVSAVLAGLLGRTAYDLDEEILKKSEHKTIEAIFLIEGEDTYRSLEQSALERILSMESYVLATGGGVIEKRENREMLESAKAKVVFLDTSFEEIERRLAGDDSRPLFKNKLQALERFELRLPLYREAADFTIVTEGLSPRAVAEKIHACVAKGGQ